MKNRYACLFILMSTLLSSMGAHAAIYREVSPSGHVTFTDSPLPYEVIRTPSVNDNIDVTKNNKWVSPNLKIKKIARLDELQDLTDDFDEAILDNWLSRSWDCTNHFERIDFKENKFLQFFSKDSPLVIPVVSQKNKLFELAYSKSIRYQFDATEKLLLNYRNQSKPYILYVCAEKDVPQRYRDRYSKYLITQEFLTGHSEGRGIEIKDGKKFLEQECRRTFEAKEYKDARTNCSLASTNKNNIAAKYYMGMLYRFNTGGESDYSLSYKQTLASAQSGFSPAYEWLAWHYRFGKGVTQNYEKALRWSIAAVDSGNLKVALSVAKFYMQGLGVEKDYTQAAVWLLIAARAGDSHAQNTLGCLYANGVGVKQDLKLAHHWIRESHYQSNPKAIFNLAVLYEQGKISKHGKSFSIPLYERAKRIGITRSDDIIDKYDRVWIN